MSTSPPITEASQKAAVLAEALPYLQRYVGHVVVVKYGGAAMGAGAATFAQDIVLLQRVGINPIVVHGGGPQINRMLDRLGIQHRFLNGLRVTDAETMDVVEMVLAGSINKQLVAAISTVGARAIGLTGKDANLIRARKLTGHGELGFVGEPEWVDAAVLEGFRGAGVVPVIAPLGVDAEGQSYNINADTMAGAVAAAVKAKRFLLLTDVPGVLDADRKLIPEIGAAEARRLIADGTISGGIIPKVETCLVELVGWFE
jgi:acetylglutamate kinase